MISRILYIVFYIIYLILIGVGLWFLLFYFNVPEWVWAFFAIAIVIVIIGVITKESFFQDHPWTIMYAFLHFIAFTLIIIGIVFIMTYSTMPWWIWTPLILGLIFSILTEMIVELSPNLVAISIFLAMLTFISFIIGLVLLITYGQTPEWLWLIFGLAILFFVLAGIFKAISYRHVVTDPCVDTIHTI